MMEYLDFEIEVGEGTNNTYPVSIVHSTSAGEARATMRFPFDEREIKYQLSQLQVALLRSGGTRRSFLYPEETDVRKFGGALFDALFTGDVRAQYAVTQDQARARDRGVRLKLRIQAPELAALPWEYLYDTRMGKYICLSSNSPIVRYPEVAQSPQVLTVTPPLSILAMTASPKDWIPLDLQRERKWLENALKPLQDKGLVKITWLEGHTWFDLQKALRRGSWHIFHFFGHGGFNDANQEGLIILENEEGKAYRLSARGLSGLLTDHYPLRLVVLNSCEGAKGNEGDIFSSTAATLVRNGVPAVLAMQYEITDKAAIALSRSFYDALADGLPVDRAVGEARKAIDLEVENTLEWGTPVLYMRSPDGFLFHIQDTQLAEEEQVRETEAEQRPPPMRFSLPEPEFSLPEPETEAEQEPPPMPGFRRSPLPRVSSLESIDLEGEDVDEDASEVEQLPPRVSSRAVRPRPNSRPSDDVPAVGTRPAQQKTRVSGQASSSKVSLIEGHWSNILLPMSAPKAKEAIISSIIESLVVSALYGIGEKSWWLFVISFLFCYLLINFGMITKREDTGLTATFIVSIGCVIGIIAFLWPLFPAWMSYNWGWLLLLIFLSLGLNAALFMEYGWLND